ncbi:MAG: hypothetical protein P8R46_12390, partial [Planctomycetota bacterium]|nr:hypothetical protein [Planctomycetota bacterium]
LEAIAAAAGVPYYQFQSEGLPAGVPPSEATSLYETRDGSHLTWAASRRFTRKLVERLQGPSSVD